MKYLSVCCIACWLVIFPAFLGWGEDWGASIRVATEDESVSAILLFGQSGSATDGFDQGLDVPAPPPPPPPVRLDAAFLGQGLLARSSADIRGVSKTAIWQVAVQSDTGGLRLSWSVDAVPKAVMLSLGGVDMRERSHMDVLKGRTILELRADACIELLLKLYEGWNLVSCPGVPCVSSISELVEGTPVQPDAWTWDVAGQKYVEAEKLVAGKAYWVLTLEDAELVLTCVPTCYLSLPLEAGWNLVGSVQKPVNLSAIEVDPEDAILLESVYRWDAAANKYALAGAILPGLGYWAAAAKPCSVEIVCPK